MEIAVEDVAHAFEEFVRVGGEKEAAAGHQRVVEALQKVPPPRIGALLAIVLGRVGMQIIGRADRVRPEQRQHGVKITADEPDVFQAGNCGFPDRAVKRLLGEVDAEKVDIRELPRPIARQHAGAAPEVDFQEPVVAEQVRRREGGEAVRLMEQVARVPNSKILRGDVLVGRGDMDSCRVSSSGHDAI